MRGSFGTITKIVIFFVIVGTIVNDAAVVATNYWLVDELAQSIARETAATYKLTGGNKNAALATAYKLCEEKQSSLTGFAIENRTVVIQVEAAPKKTVLAHHISFLQPHLSGKAIARSTPN